MAERDAPDAPVESSSSQEDAVLRAKGGDKDAFARLLECYRAFVRSKARRFAAAGADVEDLVQEGYIGLYKAVKEYNLHRSVPFSSFASLCITRQMLSAIKASKRAKHLPLNTYIPLFPDEDDQQQTPPDLVASEAADTDPEQIVLQQETLEYYRNAIENALSEFEKSVLQMYLSGMSYKDMAKAVSKPVKSIDNAISRIKQKLSLEGKQIEI